LSDTVRGSTARANPGLKPARRFGGMDLLRQAIRMTARDWRAGELTMLLLALVLAVAALSSVGFLADRLHQGLERDARRSICRASQSAGS
jgi:putative ABC transport system permease protein